MKKLITGVFCGVVLLWGGFWFFIYRGLPGLAERGQFGDMFGAVNSLFSGLAFAGVVIAIYLQTQELRHQREAQEKSEQALREQVEQMQKTAELQATTTVFNFLEDKARRGPSSGSGTISAEYARRLNQLQSAALDYLIDSIPAVVEKARSGAETGES